MQSPPNTQNLTEDAYVFMAYLIRSKISVYNCFNEEQTKKEMSLKKHGIDRFGRKCK